MPYPEFGIDVSAPIACLGGSGYPICDGACDSGLSCQGFVQSGGACYCVP